MCTPYPSSKKNVHSLCRLLFEVHSANQSNTKTAYKQLLLYSFFKPSSQGGEIAIINVSVAQYWDGHTARDFQVTLGWLCGLAPSYAMPRIENFGPTTKK